jgi:antitoxin (DNA-binding transcriptional repressor) of toxin-antitoxin stability system
MKTISLLEFRRNAQQVIRWARRGQRMIMTYRGKPVCRIEPLDDEQPQGDDPFYGLCDLAGDDGEDLTNEEIDRTVYGI